MINSGVYQLLIEMPSAKRIKVGSLGMIKFEAGHYVYTGSAKNSLPRRLSRHFSRDKVKFWHIDYLLQLGEIIAYNMEQFSPGLECRLNKMTRARLPGSKYISGFGSSDCNCPSHLIYAGSGKRHSLPSV